MIRLCLLAPDAWQYVGDLSPSDFSAPILGKVFALLSKRGAQGVGAGLSALAGDLDQDEMDHLTHVISYPEDLSQIQKSMSDYIAIIRAEAQRREISDDDTLLRAAQQRYQKQKAYFIFIF